MEIDQSAPSTTVDVKATETPPSSNITEHNTVSSLNNSNTNGDTSKAPPTPTLTPAHDSINAGQLALRNSNWQAAIDSYILALEQTDEDDELHLDAHLGLAHSYLRSKAMWTALETLET